MGSNLEQSNRGARVDPTTIALIGDTRLVDLKALVPSGCARILLKVEAENPTGSMKDRMALAMIEAAEADGRLVPGKSVVEYTAGSTGVSLAFVCALKGYSITLVTSDAFSAEKRRHMAALGAEVKLVPSDGGRMDAGLTNRMIDEARRIADETDAFLVNQLHNADQLGAYHRLGEEIWTQTSGRIDAFVQFVGSSGSCRGVSEALHRHDPGVHCVAVEPSESPVLSGGRAGAHKIEGVGAGFVVPLWDRSKVDEIRTVSTEQAMDMARQLARREGLLAGTSTGGNVVAAIETGLRLGPEAVVVSLMCDSGMKYLSTPLYADDRVPATPMGRPT